MRSALVVVGLTLLLLVGVWLTTDNTSMPQVASQDQRPPNVIIDGLHRITTSADGLWQSTLTADQAHYYEDEDQLFLTTPRLWTQSESAYEMTAQRAELRTGNHWVMQGDVRITSDGESTAPITIRTDFLEYDTLSEIAQTPAPVEIVQTDRLHTTAVGMTLNLTTEEFELHEQVRSLFYPEP